MKLVFKMMKKAAPVCVIAVSMLFIFPCYSFAKATPNGYFDVYAPTGTGYSGNLVLYGSAPQAMKLDGQYAYVTGLGSYIKVQDFTSTIYTNYWDPYSNRSAFPPDNATILGVSVIAVVRANVLKPFTLMMAYSNTSPMHIHTVLSPMFYATTSDVVYSHNITQDLIDTGIIPSWNAGILKNTVPHEDFYVELMSWADTGGWVLYVDYVGISYIWCYPGGGGGSGGPGGGPEDVNLQLPDVMGLMGMTGFIGMIGIPAASIWFFRHDGGSKIHAGVMALIGFTVCFGFFLASINGG